MDKIFKVYSVQSEDLSSTQDLLDFEIPEGEMLDLSKSYVSINARVAGDGTGNHAGGIFNIEGVFEMVDAANSRTSDYVPNIALVKNARMVSSQKGMVEELRDVNQLRLLLKNVYESRDKYLSRQHTGLQGIRRGEIWGDLSPLIDVTSETGTGTGKYIDKRIKIPLSDILEIGKVTEFDTGRIGKCKLHLELDMGRLSAAHVQPDVKYFTTDNSGKQNGVLVNTAVAGTLLTAVLGDGTPKTYDEDYQEHLPYYVGMPVVVGSGTLDGADLSNAKNVITDISYNSTTGAVTLTFGTSFGTIAAAGTVGVMIQPAAPGDVTASITLGQAELVLHALGSNNKPASPPAEIEFMKYTLERDDGQGNKGFKRQYEVEPNATNLIVLEKNLSNELLSNLPSDGGYRVAINNELQNDRNVFNYNPLFYHQLSKFSLNQGEEINNVGNIQYVKNPAYDVAAPNNDENRGTLNQLNYIVQPLPITSGMKLVELDIEHSAAAGVKGLNIYKQVVSTI